MKMLSSATKTVIAPMTSIQHQTGLEGQGAGTTPCGDASHTPQTPVSALEATSK
jgi:hypothetical protein